MKFIFAEELPYDASSPSDTSPESTRDRSPVRDDDFDVGGESEGPRYDAMRSHVFEYDFDGGGDPLEADEPVYDATDATRSSQHDPIDGDDFDEEGSLSDDEDEEDTFFSRLDSEAENIRRNRLWRSASSVKRKAAIEKGRMKLMRAHEMQPLLIEALLKNK